MSARLRLSLVLPLLGVVALIGKAELAQRRGVELLVPIMGYDPRDLLRGHYLRFTYHWDWQGSQRCEEREDCCLCVEPPAEREPAEEAKVTPLQSSAPGIEAEPQIEQVRARPRARMMSCQRARDCSHHLRTGEEGPPTRYYVPEGLAQALETAIRQREAAVLLSIDRTGRGVIRDLYLDGHPWREQRDTLRRPER